MVPRCPAPKLRYILGTDGDWRPMADSIVVTERDKDRLFQVVDLFLAQRYDVLVAFLRRELERAKVVPSEQVPRHIATMNSRVRYRDNDTGEVYTVSLVYPGEEDSLLGRVSVLSPVGAALLGLSEGQSIQWTTIDARPRSLTLLSVLFQPEATGRFDL
jgi:regulator of nucleoside diphosphate kinase